MTNKMEMMVNEMKTYLIGQEMSYADIDNIMISKRFYSNFADGMVNDRKEANSMTYQSIRESDDQETFYLLIEFVVIDDRNDTLDEDFTLRIEDIYYI